MDYCSAIYWWVISHPITKKCWYLVGELFTVQAVIKPKCCRVMHPPPHHICRFRNLFHLTIDRPGDPQTGSLDEVTLGSRTKLSKLWCMRHMYYSPAILLISLDLYFFCASLSSDEFWRAKRFLPILLAISNKTWDLIFFLKTDKILNLQSRSHSIQVQATNHS